MRLVAEAFLYALTAQEEYKTNLRLRQQAGKYWEYTGDKFYDTAVALYPISDEPIEKTNTKNWLLEIQASDGCWQGHIRNTAFILASIWPKPVDPTVRSCTDSGYYCGSEISCEGNLLPDYTCPGVSVCCDTQPVIKSCSEQDGTICTSDEKCVGGTTTTASDTSIGEECCLGGECEILTTASECENQLGRCTPFCSSGEVEADYECSLIGDVCCVLGEKKSSLWWLWVLIILIILVVIGIIFRSKLRGLFKRGPRPMGPGPRPGMPPSAIRRPLQRRILPPQKRPQASKPAKKPDELGDVLSKLKQMSK